MGLRKNFIVPVVGSHVYILPLTDNFKNILMEGLKHVWHDIYDRGRQKSKAVFFFLLISVGNLTITAP